MIVQFIKMLEPKKIKGTKKQTDKKPFLVFNEIMRDHHLTELSTKDKKSKSSVQILYEDMY